MTIHDLGNGYYVCDSQIDDIMVGHMADDILNDADAKTAEMIYIKHGRRLGNKMGNLSIIDVACRFVNEQNDIFIKEDIDMCYVLYNRKDGKTIYGPGLGIDDHRWFSKVFNISQDAIDAVRAQKLKQWKEEANG